MHLTLRQLHYFVGIVDAQSMTRAAERLNVAPTALSLQVKSMEEGLGVALLNRHSRGVEPTEPGRELYHRARRILDLVSEAEAAVGTRRQPAVIRGGAPPAVARAFGLPAILAASRRDGTVLELMEGWSRDLAQKLAEGELDFVVGYGFEPGGPFDVHELLEERLGFVGAPGSMPAAGKVSLATVLASDLVFYGRESISWKAAVRHAGRIGARVNVWREVDSVEVWRQALITGHGKALVSFGAVSEEVQRGELAYREIEGPPIVARISLAIRREGDQPVLSAGFTTFLVAVVIGAYDSILRTEAAGPGSGPPAVLADAD
jgi:LysR family nitrogen assimilation transcriptional regulator